MKLPTASHANSLLLCAFFFLPTGCERQPEPTQKPPAPTLSAAPSSQPAAPKPPPSDARPNPHAADGAAGALSPAGAFVQGGLSITIPETWQPEPLPTGPMAALASYRLPRVEGDTDDAVVRISHYPSMKGKDDANIDRWIGQVRRADGQPSTREDAKISTFELGTIRVTVVDVSGAIAMGMMGGGDVRPDYRAINAIVDHPNGPHFVRASGPAKTVEKWAGSIDEAVRSASVVP